MSHYCLLALIPGDTPKEAITDAVQSLMAPFDENLDVPRFKQYWFKSDLTSMAETYKFDPDAANVLDEIRSHIHDWNDKNPEDVDRDERGIFSWETLNPIGKWDWYDIGGRWDGYLHDDDYRGKNAPTMTAVRYANYRTVSTLNLASLEYPPFAVAWWRKRLDGQIVPEWSQKETFTYNPDDRDSNGFNTKDPDDWRAEVQRILDDHSTDIAVCVDYHQ